MASDRQRLSLGTWLGFCLVAALAAASSAALTRWGRPQEIVTVLDAATARTTRHLEKRMKRTSQEFRRDLGDLRTYVDAGREERSTLKAQVAALEQQLKTRNTEHRLKRVEVVCQTAQKDTQAVKRDVADMADVVLPPSTTTTTTLPPPVPWWRRLPGVE